ncbi:alpha/beta hydrolase family protein [Streptomyces piniterrae]|uniref:alpha/beta hydrolase family protein n=1 Tax=Streptomyces piniterrae TaxID=2571125 RepID=UPI001C9E24FF|nr:prolyl oligopeptidase family serine peptidase [Streptomyces piniterrae]
MSFRGGGGVELHGSVVRPAGAPAQRDAGVRNGARPGLVVIQGSGKGAREDYRKEAEAYASRGVVTLIYDKRSVGYSLLERDFSLLADDALAAVRKLRRIPGVDPRRVGVLGISEGAWVAPLAAGRSADVAFVATVGAGTAPARQQAWSYGNQLRHRGVTGSLLKTVQVRAVGLMVAAGLFPEAEHDPTPPLTRIRQPVLAMWGRYDRVSPPGEGAGLFRAALKHGAVSSYTIRVFDDGEHGLRRARDDGFDHDDAFVPGYIDFAAGWISGVPDELPANSADPLPEQARMSAPLAPLEFYESSWSQLVVIVVLLGAYGGCLVTRGTSEFGGERWPAAAGILTVLGAFGYLGYLVVTAAESPGPVVVGRPLPWLVLQLLAVVVVCAAVRSAYVRWRMRRKSTDGCRSAGRIRPALLLAGTALFVPWAVYWGLLIP